MAGIRNENLDQISGHPYRVIKYNNVSFQNQGIAKGAADPNVAQIKQRPKKNNVAAENNYFGQSLRENREENQPSGPGYNPRQIDQQY